MPVEVDAHVFNVGHGDSTVFHIRNDDVERWVLYDIRSLTRNKERYVQPTGLLHQKLASGDFELDQFPEMNHASMVLMLTVDQQVSVWAADSPPKQWTEQHLASNRDGILNHGATVLRASHHGSRHNNVEKNYNFIFAPVADSRTVILRHGSRRIDRTAPQRGAQRRAG